MFLPIRLQEFQAGTAEGEAHLEIYKLLKQRGVTQKEAAKLLGTTQAQVSALMRCKPVSVSVGRLMEFLNVLGQDVEVTVRPAGRHKIGDMSVVVQPS